MPEPKNGVSARLGAKGRTANDAKKRRESLSFLLAGKRGGGKVAPRLVSRSPVMRVSQSVSEAVPFGEHRG